MNELIIDRGADIISNQEKIEYLQATEIELNTKLSRNKSNPFIKFIVTSFLAFNTSGDMNECKITKAKENVIINHSQEDVEAFISSYLENVEKPIFHLTDTFSNSIVSKKDLIEKILSFKSLCNNWDGYSSIPLEVQSATNSILMIEWIGESLFGSLEDFYPNPHGTISFEWVNNLKECLVLEVGNSSMSYYYELLGNKTVYVDNKKICEKETELIAQIISSL